MFKDNKRAGKVSDTLIGVGSDIQGKLRCESNLRLEGKFQGEIETTGEIVIGESGEAHSTIKGNEIIVAGKVFGDIITEGKLTITASGQVDGNVSAHTLVILDGGILNGISIMERPVVSRVPSSSSAPAGKSKNVPQPEAG
ncbi:polymer-forming cytoskeletal protein [Paenibacillus zeisoli]|uniref:Polymer-forming cytoskeletal protein n=1 Tax=Paenibacillus zeisoli TaxID=2496267 RepID=A0A3S1B6Y0_9BACL|nr:polymer-forming cytoskeletal protein [Paenibacillus zeisoli]RUT30606.1 polymer-forming cytoskeletal protein [Paenibacillus zeisoli]